MATDTRLLKTKKPTPLSTRALAAYLTWKQFDLLLLLNMDGTATTSQLADDLEDIKAYDVRHGGAFYAGVGYSSVYSCLRTLEDRQLVSRHVERNGFISWSIRARGVKAIDWLEKN
jgi:hypothetical protein